MSGYVGSTAVHAFSLIYFILFYFLAFFAKIAWLLLRVDAENAQALAHRNMYDPLASTPASPFASSSSAQTPPWPTTPHSPELEPTFGRRPNPPDTLTRAPYDPNPREPRIYGQQEPGLISPSSNTLSNGSNLERLEPYVRIRLTALDRNRRDILIRFDAQVCLL